MKILASEKHFSLVWHNLKDEVSSFVKLFPEKRSRKDYHSGIGQHCHSSASVDNVDDRLLKLDGSISGRHQSTSGLERATRRHRVGDGQLVGRRDLRQADPLRLRQDA
jgi:hypothetical protein